MYPIFQLIMQELAVAKADLKTYVLVCLFDYRMVGLTRFLFLFLSHDSGLYKDNLAYIQLLESQLAGLKENLNRLEASQLVLVGRLTDCCKNGSVLAGLVKTGVHEQLATVGF